MTIMIKNEREYRIENSKLRETKLLIANMLDSGRGERSPHEFAGRIHNLFNEWTAGREKVCFYQNLASGVQSCEPFFALSQVPQLWIEARTASGLSQEELASELGIAHQNVQRHEKGDYGSVSLDRMVAIEDVLRTAFCGRMYFNPQFNDVSKMAGTLALVGASEAFVQECLVPAVEVFVRLTAQDARVQGQLSLFAVCAEEVFGVSADRLLTKVSEDVSRMLEINALSHLTYICNVLTDAWAKEVVEEELTAWYWGPRMSVDCHVRSNVALVFDSLNDRGQVFFPIHEDLFPGDTCVFSSGNLSRKMELRIIRRDSDPKIFVRESGVGRKVEQQLEDVDPILFWNLALEHQIGRLSRANIPRFQALLLDQVLTLSSS